MIRTPFLAWTKVSTDSERRECFQNLRPTRGLSQIENCNCDRDETAQTSWHGLYRFTRMLFEEKKPPVAFRRATDVILAFVRRQFRLDYLDYIVVFFKSPQHHIEQVRQISSLWPEAGTTIPRKKGKFFSKIVDYVNYFIRSGRRELVKQTTETVPKLENPSTKTELYPFLVPCNVFRRFLPNFAPVGATPNKTLWIDQPKTFGPWNGKESATVASLKEIFINPPLFVLPLTKR